MRILVVNPNTTDSMTQRIAAAARAVASPTTQIIARTSAHGPARAGAATAPLLAPLLLLLVVVVVAPAGAAPVQE